MSDSFKVLAFVTMVVGFFLFHTWVRTQVLTTGYDLGRTQKRIRILDSQKFALKIEKSRLMSPQSLESLVQKFAEQGEVFESPQASQIYYLNIEANELNVSKSH